MSKPSQFVEKSTIQFTNKSETAPIVVVAARGRYFNSLKKFLHKLPRDLDLVYLLYLQEETGNGHVPEELMAMDTPLPIKGLAQDDNLLPNQIYLITSGTNHGLRINHSLEEIDSRDLDHFLKSLVSACDKLMAAIILSSDSLQGLQGIDDIRQKGCQVVFLEPEDNTSRELPELLVDGGRIERLFTIHQLRQFLVDTSNKFAVTTFEETIPQQDLSFPILNLLKSKKKIAPGAYVQGKLAEAIRWRMLVLKCDTINSYYDLLVNDPDEIQQLTDSITIRSDYFFPEPATFEHFGQKIIPELIQIKEGLTLRIWLPGGDSGAYAYSLAIVIREVIERIFKVVKVKIFVTSQDADLLKKARTGIIPEKVAERISQSRRDRFIEKTIHGYQVAPEIRNMVNFSKHDLLRDLPFIKLDLIVYRNQLMVFDQKTQDTLLSTFHHALEDHGVLVVGSLEKVVDTQLFDHPIVKLPFYRRKTTDKMPRLPVYQFDKQDNPEYNLIQYVSAHHRALDHFVPPHIMIDEEGNIQHTSKSARSYLKYPGGLPTQNAHKLLHPQLARLLNQLLKLSTRDIKPHKSDVVQLGAPINQSLSLHVVPCVTEIKKSYLVFFQQSEVESQAKLPEEAYTSASYGGQPAIPPAESYRESTWDEVDFNGEKLKATNKKLQETLKELEINSQELQIANLELASLNRDYLHKVEALNLMSNDLENVLNASDIAILFLDKDLNIKRFTPGINDIFSLRSTDEGRPIMDLSPKIHYPALAADSMCVMQSHQFLEKEVQGDGEIVYLVRILPYLTQNNMVDGVVLNFIDITTTIKAEEAIRFSEERFNIISQATNDIIWDWHLDSGKMWWNRALEVLCGFAESDIGDDVDWWFQNIHPEDRDRVVTHLYKFIDGESDAWTEEYRLKCSDNQYLDILDRGYLIRNQKGKPIRMVGSKMDITSRKRVVEDLKKSETLFKTFTEAMPQMAFIADSAGNITFYNQRWFNYIGRSEKTEAGTWKDRSIHHPDDLEKAIQKWNYSVRTGESYEIEYRLRRYDGEYRWHLGRAVPIHNGSGGIEMWLGTNTDIHNQKQIEAVLKQNQDRLQEISDSLKLATRASKLGWTKLNLVENSIELDFRAREILGVTSSKLTLDEFNNLVHPEDQDKFRTHHQEIAEKQVPFDLEYCIINPNGETRYVHGTGELIFAPDGTPIKGSGLLRDITERKQLQHQKDDFLAIASHEMKTPVSVMKGYISLIERSLHKKGHTTEASLAAKVSEQVIRLTSLINDLLDVTRIEAGKIRFDHSEYDFDQMVAEVAESMQQLFDHHLIIKGTTGKKVRGDKIRTSQVVTNFLSNAVKYSPQAHEVIIYRRCAGKEVLLEVQDFGCGIAEKDVQKVFDRFYRVRSSGHRDTGLGLGLYISAEIIRRQNGNVFVKSKEGEGSTFGFSLPLDSA